MQHLVIGYGWLGKQLAKVLTEDAAVTVAQRSDPEHLPENIRYKMYGLGIPMPAWFKKVDVLFLCVPPGTKKDPEALEYLKALEKFLKQMEGFEGQFNFCSSIGVYADKAKYCPEIAPLPEEYIGKQALVKAENLVLHYLPKANIIRLGGLFGPDRNPATWFAGKQDIEGGLDPVNNVHLFDAIDILRFIAQKKTKGLVFNAVSPEHPTKQEYYSLAIEKAGLEPATFVSNALKTRVVNPQALLNLGYEFTIDNPLEGLDYMVLPEE